MKAIVQDEYGDSGVLRLDDVDTPAPGADEVLIEVRAAGVDRGAWHMMTGLPYLSRLAFGLRRPRNRTIGMDLAGRVAAVGANVTGFQPGDEVFGTGKAAFAEYAVARANKLLRKPAHLSFEQAAAMPTSGATALKAIRPGGERVLIIGAGGGVGSFAVQLAKRSGAHVTGVCSTAKVEMVRSLGADEVIDYTREPLTGTYDLVVDIAGNRSLRELRPLLTPKGTLMLTGGEDGDRVTGGMGRQLGAAALSAFSGQRMRTVLAFTTVADLEALAGLTPAVDRAFPLAEAPAAIQYLADGKARGKLVLTI
jgi:NADPH:quinone reductase-like Zn-dependent oxidoreductase